MALEIKLLNEYNPYFEYRNYGYADIEIKATENENLPEIENFANLSEISKIEKKEAGIYRVFISSNKTRKSYIFKSEISSPCDGKYEWNEDFNDYALINSNNEFDIESDTNKPYYRLIIIENKYCIVDFNDDIIYQSILNSNIENIPYPILTSNSEKSNGTIICNNRAYDDIAFTKTISFELNSEIYTFDVIFYTTLKFGENFNTELIPEYGITYNNNRNQSLGFYYNGSIELNSSIIIKLFENDKSYLDNAGNFIIDNFDEKGNFINNVTKNIRYSKALKNGQNYYTIREGQIDNFNDNNKNVSDNFKCEFNSIFKHCHYLFELTNNSTESDTIYNLKVYQVFPHELKIEINGETVLCNEDNIINDTIIPIQTANKTPICSVEINSFEKDKFINLPLLLNDDENSIISLGKILFDHENILKVDKLSFIYFGSYSFVDKNTGNEHKVSSNFYYRNGKYIEFPLVKEENGINDVYEYFAGKKSLLNFVNKPNFINGEYHYYIAQYNLNNTITNYNCKDLEIIFYPNNLNVKNKQDYNFIKTMDYFMPTADSNGNYDMTKSKGIADYKFEIVYEYNDENGNPTKENIKNLNFVQAKIAVNSQAGIEGLDTFIPFVDSSSSSDSSNNSGETVELNGVVYPNLFSNVDNFTENNLMFKMVDFDNLKDNYYHIYLPFGQKVKLNPECLTVSGILNKTSGYSNETIAKNASNANGNYFYVSGSGSSRIFKHETNDYWIRKCNYYGENYFCISAKEDTSDISNSCVCRTDNYEFPDETKTPTKDFPTYDWQDWHNNCNFDSFSMVYTPAETEDGIERIYYIILEDKYGNKTSVTSSHTQVYNVAPYEMFLKITGSSNEEHYTGFYQKENRFIPSEFVEIMFSAQSKTPLKYKITGTIANIDNEWKILKNNNKQRQVIKLNPTSGSNPLLNRDITSVITITFKDEAGNTSVKEEEIRFISQLHRTKYFNLIEESNTYSHRLQGQNSSIPRNRTSTTEFYRSWNEVWFPESHGSPLNNDGTIDEIKAKVIANGTPGTDYDASLYDKLAIDSQGNLMVDSDGRFLQNLSAWSNNKLYPADMNKMGSNSANNTYKYWIIDNTGNADFKLEFEVFKLDNSITAVPRNYSSPYEGDVLVVYDASAVGCVEESTDDYGNTVYTLKNTSQLQELFALKGNDKDGFQILGNNYVGDLSLNDNGFITPSINSTTRICLIMFSDSANQSSGFKLKAGPKHAYQYSNYESIEKIGEFWVHLSPATSNGTWSGISELEIEYNYYASLATIDKEKNSVSFEEYQKYNIMGTFSNYLYLYTDGTNTYPYPYFYNITSNYPYHKQAIEIDENNVLKTFLLYQDDLLDYSEPSFYVIPNGINAIKHENYNFNNYEVENRGKISSNYTLNKDTGVLVFTGLTPLGRLSGDYYYHTFFRLTNDGYGDLTYYDNTIVPASVSNSYRDWTYVDLKVVNEGTNALNNGTLKFLARGYITAGTTVDTVLDNNRPWDVQMGTIAETVTRTGASFSTSYSALPAADEVNGRKNAFNARSSQTCTFGTIAPKSSVYIRVWWCIANDANGTSWIDCTRGAKLYSAELSGKFYLFTT